MLVPCRPQHRHPDRCRRFGREWLGDLPRPRSTVGGPPHWGRL